MKVAGILVVLSSALSTALAASMDGSSALYGWASGGYLIDQTERADRNCKSTYAFRASTSKKRYQENTLLDKIRKDERFSKLMEVLEKNRGLRDDLDSTDRKITFFAPTNEAFEKSKEMWGDMKRRRKHDDDDRKPSMEQFVRYHMTHEEIKSDELYDGQLIESQLKLKELDGEKQRIKVFKLRGEYLLNMYARVEESDIEAQNGVMHGTCLLCLIYDFQFLDAHLLKNPADAHNDTFSQKVIDRVLVPPPRMMSVMSMLPTKFSTFLWALHRVGLHNELDEEKALSVFAPTNSAWENLGMTRLFYLFSHAGREDLRKIMEYHIGTELVYSSEMIDQKQVSVPTMLKGEELNIKATCRSEKSKDRCFERDDEERDSKRRCRRENRDRCDRDYERTRKGGDRKKRSPSEYLIMVNEETQVVYHDGITENGVIHAVSDVMIPSSVCLGDM
ncbi:hypothetical protein HK102_002263 [Quaeritorhiza haematococci]|nr:hypothetical protein HK102_002263 [Quaeritorhiza haematococci]